MQKETIMHQKYLLILFYSASGAVKNLLMPLPMELRKKVLRLELERCQGFPR